MSHYYIIANYASRKEEWEYVSEVVPNTTNPEVFPEVWTTTQPYKWDGHQHDQRPPFRFEKRTDAVRILDPLRAARRAYWDQHGYMLRSRFGDSRPVWKIYKITG